MSYLIIIIREYKNECIYLKYTIKYKMPSQIFFSLF